MSNKKCILPPCSVRLEITGGFLLLCTATGFFCGGGALLAAALAAAIHEWGHVAAMLCQGSVPCALRLDASGACLRAAELPAYRQELLRALAGPLCGLLFGAAFLRSASPLLSRSAALSLLLSGINLLPGRGLDGGRALRCLVLQRSEAAAGERILRRVEWAAAIACFAAGLVLNAQLCLYGVWLLLRSAGIGDSD